MSERTTLDRSRDIWAARAKKAEERIHELERELANAVTAGKGVAALATKHAVGLERERDAAIERRDYYKSGQEILQEEWDNLDSDNKQLVARNAVLVEALQAMIDEPEYGMRASPALGKAKSAIADTTDAEREMLAKAKAAASAMKVAAEGLTCDWCFGHGANLAIEEFCLMCHGDPIPSPESVATGILDGSLRVVRG